MSEAKPVQRRRGLPLIIIGAVVGVIAVVRFVMLLATLGEDPAFVAGETVGVVILALLAAALITVGVRRRRVSA